MRKSAFCICRNKDADQLCDNSTADQRLYFQYTDSTIPLLPKTEISSLQPSSVAVQLGLCCTWSGTSRFSRDEAHIARELLHAYSVLFESQGNVIIKIAVQFYFAPRRL